MSAAARTATKVQQSFFGGSQEPPGATAALAEASAQAHSVQLVYLHLHVGSTSLGTVIDGTRAQDSV